MNIDVLLIRVTATIFAVYGLAFVLAPTTLALLVTEASPANSAALTDMRATYGGMSVAVGMLLFILAAEPKFFRLGLSAVLLLMLGMAGGRAVGIFLDGPTTQIMWVYLALEIIVATIASLLLLRSRKAER